MIDGLKPYLDYKESGLPWLGKVPEHWNVYSARHIGRIFKGVGGTKEDAISNGVPCVRYGDLYTTHSYFIRATNAFVSVDAAAGYTPIQYADILFAASGETIEEIGKSAVNLMQSSAVCGGDVIILRPAIPVHAPFLGYATDCRSATNQKASMARGSTVKHIYPDELRNLLMALPPPVEQEAIVRFLDWANARLDRAIRAKRKMIGLLNEQKRAIIQQAVTRGLDPTVPLKPSGVEWIGDIPTQWRVVPLGRVSTKRCDGPFGSGLKSTHYAERGVRVIRLQNIGFAEFHNGNSVYIDPEYYASLGDHDVLRGDLLIAGLGDNRIPAGRACVAPSDIEPAMVKADCFRFRPDKCTVDPQFAAYQLSATAEVAGAILSTGATRQRINLGATASRAVALPPLSEQQSIVAYISRMTEPLDKSAERIKAEIDLLREYRTRLVSDVVTGQLDVRGLDLPDLGDDVSLDLSGAIEDGDEVDGEETGGDLADGEGGEDEV